MHDDWQGKGVGAALMRAGLTFADNWLNLTRVELEVYADNEAAIHLYERFGFELEERCDSMRFAMGNTLIGR